MILLLLLVPLASATACFFGWQGAFDPPANDVALMGTVMSSEKTTIDGNEVALLKIRKAAQFPDTRKTSRFVELVQPWGGTPPIGANIVAAGNWNGEQVTGYWELVEDDSLNGNFEFSWNPSSYLRQEFELAKDLDRLKSMKTGKVALLKRIARHPKFNFTQEYLILVHAHLTDPKLRQFVMSHYEIVRAEEERAAEEAREKFYRERRETDDGIGLVAFALLWHFETAVACAMAIWVKRRLCDRGPEPFTRAVFDAL